MSAVGLLCLLSLLLPADTPPRGAVTVLFELLPTGHMAVPVKVNGKGPYRLIFDTGAPLTLLNNKIGRAAGLVKDQETPLFSLLGAVNEVTVPRLEVGRQAAEKVPAVVMDHPVVEAISRAFGPIDGIVGFPFFARFKMTIDYQAKTLTFEPSTYQPADVLRSLLDSILSGARDAGPRTLAPAAQWGFSVRPKERGDEKPGVLIDKVWHDSSAARAGLRPGDRLLKLDGRWTDSVADVFAAVEAVQAGTSARVRIERGGREIDLRVRPRRGL
jgi:membrane-associated protease RseP (regulator of RpoE activity)